MVMTQSNQPYNTKSLQIVQDRCRGTRTSETSTKVTQRKRAKLYLRGLFPKFLSKKKKMGFMEIGTFVKCVSIHVRKFFCVSIHVRKFFVKI